MIAIGMSRPYRRAFTILELLVSIAVLALIMVLIAQIFSAALAVTGTRNKRMDADAQARVVFDRMAIDIAQMVKRADVDFFLKSSTADQYGNPAQPQPGNDQIAFYSQVPGYFTSGAAQSPVSLVAYRVNADSSSPQYNNKLQRLGYGLLWSVGGNIIPVTDGSTPAMPVVFSSSGINNAISYYWPIATNMTANPNYELAGPQVFRMEYYYVLKGSNTIGASGSPLSSTLSDTPWDTRSPLNHTSVNGLQDVAAIAVVIAVVDPKSLILVKDKQLTDLAAAMQDFDHPIATPNPGDLEAQWQAAIDDTANGIPRAAAAGIRVYSRTFYLPASITQNQ